MRSIFSTKQLWTAQYIPFCKTLVSLQRIKSVWQVSPETIFSRLWSWLRHLRRNRYQSFTRHRAAWIACFQRASQSTLSCRSRRRWWCNLRLYTAAQSHDSSVSGKASRAAASLYNGWLSDQTEHYTEFSINVGCNARFNANKLCAWRHSIPASLTIISCEHENRQRLQFTTEFAKRQTTSWKN